jgi:membrane fusion protein, multidrug efflux system
LLFSSKPYGAHDMDRTDSANALTDRETGIEDSLRTEESTNGASAPESLKSEKTETKPKPSTVARPAEADLPASPPKAKRSFNRKPFIFAGLAVGALVAAVAGYNWWQYSTAHEDTDNATLIGHILPVSARINGTVRSVLVQDNQMVKAGAPLVKLDDQDYQIKLQSAQSALQLAQRQASTASSNIALARGRAGAQAIQAKGGVAGATSTISSAQSAVTEARTGIPVAKAQLAQAQANFRKAELDYNRYRSLEQAGAIARQQLDSAKAAYDVARSSQDAAQSGVRQAEARLAQAQDKVATAQAQLAQSQGALEDAGATALQTNVRQNEYAAAHAAIDQAKVALKDAQLQLSYTNLKAPSSGRIGRKAVEVGQRVQPGQPLLAIVENQVWVVANFKETQLERMRPGQEAEVKLDSLPSHIFKGKVDSVAPASGAQFSLLPPDNATGNFTKIVQRIPVKVVLDPKSLKGYESLLTPGMSATVSVAVK